MPHSRRGTRRCLPALCLLLCAGPAGAVEPEDLRRGLVATYCDAAKPRPAEVVRLEPLIALALAAGEAPHPRLQADGGSVTWQGHINILRRGAYRFLVRLRGRFRLVVAGKDVLAAEVTEARPALKEGEEVRLEAGVHPIVAEFTRLPGPARVELTWEARHFRREPLPFDHLGHLPSQAPVRLAADSLVERGRSLAEEAGCVRCHQPTGDNRMVKGLVPHAGPDLSRVGRRVRPGWLMRWLESPARLRPGAVMPAMFAAGQPGHAERYAVTRYLTSLGGPVRSNPRQPDLKEADAARLRGQRLFTSVGCVACHGSPGGDRGRSFVLVPPVRLYPLSGLGSKTTPEQLAAYLVNPLAVDPSGRMPHMLLSGREAEDLAHFLCQSRVEDLAGALPPEPPEAQLLAAFRRVDDRADELEAFRRLPAGQRWPELGERLVIDKGCNNCHTIAPGGKPFASVQARASLEEVREPGRQTSGCLAADAGKRGQAPAFAFTDGDREALRAFLREGLAGAGSPAPAYAARAAVGRFNCLACHGRDGDGGLSVGVVEELRRHENAENAEAVVPPPLTGVGHKLRTPWLRQVLVGAGRARPWMGLRMPQFGVGNVGELPEALAALEGAEPDETVHRVPPTAARIEAGRRLVGKNALGCVSCHDLAGIPNRGTRGPDLALMNQRVRFDWYTRWLEQPQRMQPGTRMPAVFSGGKSQVESVLGGSAAAQAEALWAYLSLGASLPLPRDLESGKAGQPRKGGRE